MAPILRIQLLGEFRLYMDDQLLHLVMKPRLQALLAHLLLHRHMPQPRQQIAFCFWPDSSEEQAHTNLRKLLYQLRQVLPTVEEFLYNDRQNLGWRFDDASTLDVAMLEQALLRLEQATVPDVASVGEVIALYQGELLPACYDEWLLPLRRALHERVVNGLAAAVADLMTHRLYDAAIGCAEHLLRLDPLHEAAYSRLMELRAITGDRTGALRLYHECVRALEQELGVPPNAETQHIYARLLQATPEAPAPTPTAQLANPIELVGRQAEWRQLQSAWQSARHHPHFVLIWGEAGSGKTRLTEELLRWARPHAGAFAYARSYAAEGALVYAPVTAWLRTGALHRACSQLEDLWLVEIARVLPEVRTTHPHLPLPAPLLEDWQRQRFFEAMATGVLAAPHPLLLVLDDLQWCDVETLRWLRYLMRFATTTPLLLVGAARSEEVDGGHPLQELVRQLHREGQCSEIELAPLNAKETLHLAKQVAGMTEAGAAEEGWGAALYRETEGNPLFVLETVRAGYLARANGGERSLPPTVQAVISGRLAQLSPHARQLAQLAATVGRAFTIELLNRAWGGNLDVLVPGLDELWQRRIVREHGVGYDFSHDRIREVAYGEISPVRRRLLHSQVAQALEQLHAERLPEVAAEIAPHYLQAAMQPPAARYFEMAGSHAAGRFANDEAVLYFTRALACLAEAESRARYRLLLLREDIFFLTGNMEGRSQDLAALQELSLILDREAGTSRHQAEVLIRCARHAESAGHHREQVQLAQRGAELAQASDANQVEAFGYFYWGKGFWGQGELNRAYELLQQAAAKARAAGLATLEADALEIVAATGMFSGASAAQMLEYLHRCLVIHRQEGNLVRQPSIYNKFGYLIVAQGNGRYPEAKEHYMHGMALATQTGNAVLQCNLLANLGVLAVCQGDYRQANEDLSAALQLAQATGSRLFEASSHNYMGYARYNAGDYAAAEGHQLAAIKITQATGNRQWRTKAHNGLSLVYHALGRQGAAREQAELALQVASELEDSRQQAAAYTSLGYILTALEQLEEAANAYRQAYRLRQEMEQYTRALEPLAGLAELALLRGDAQAALELVGQIVTALQVSETDYTDDGLRVYLVCYQVLHACQDARALAWLHAAQAQLAARAATLESEAMRTLFWAAPLHRVVQGALAA
jgi:predicted ATPase/DNA-binding SARP family transcriptional activator